MPLPFAAMGIGALIGGLGAKQRGGNFLKGALTGAALGGITGGFGASKFGPNAGGIFGLGKKMLPNFLAMSGIGMGTEMFGQQEANLQHKLGQQRWLDEEEDRRVARLNEYAGYDVTDPKNFLTPQKFFMAGGGLASLPHYANGGWHDVPMEEGGPTMDPEIMRLPMGQEGSFEEENEGIVGLELAGLTDEEMAELQSLQSLSIVTPEGDPNYEKIQIRLQELMGRMKVAKGGHINRPGYDEGGITDIHPGTEDEGFNYDVDIDGEKYDFSFDERLTEDINEEIFTSDSPIELQALSKKVQVKESDLTFLSLSAEATGNALRKINVLKKDSKLYNEYKSNYATLKAVFFASESYEFEVGEDARTVKAIGAQAIEYFDNLVMNEGINSEDSLFQTIAKFNPGAALPNMSIFPLPSFQEESDWSSQIKVAGGSQYFIDTKTKMAELYKKGTLNHEQFLFEMDNLGKAQKLFDMRYKYALSDISIKPDERLSFAAGENAGGFSSIISNLMNKK